MTYSGNPSLAQETKKRILDTYSQTLDLAEQGRNQEAALGCDFILKMDPLFSPARELQNRLSGAEGSLDVSDLRGVLQQTGSRNGAPAAAASPPSPPPPPPAALPAESTQDGLETDELAPEVVELEGETVDAELIDPTSFDSEDLDDPSFETGSFGVESLEAEPVELLAEALEEADAMPLELEGSLVDVAETESSSGGDERVVQLLDEGQQHFEGADYQAAIDAWSRIFLIDIENEEAAHRIELARKLKDELERQAEELFHEAIDHRDAGRRDEAQAALEKVLELQPQHLAARESLEQLLTRDEASVEEKSVAPPPPTPSAPAPQQGGPAEDELFDSDLFADAASAPIVAEGRSAARPQRSFLLIGVVGILLLVVVGWFLFSRRDQLFPNAAETPPVTAQAPPRVDEIDKALRLRGDGNLEQAVAMLEGLDPSHPRFDVAQQHLANWRGELPAPEAAAEPEADPDASLARRERLLEEARAAYGRKEYLAAARAFSAADRLAPLEGPADDLFRDAKRQLLPIANQIDLFRQREWELLLPTLWRLLEREPQNRDVRRLLADSYYNLGVMDLRRSAPDRALERFREVARLQPDDRMTERLVQLSDAYSQSTVDPLYRIFVQQLDLRQ